MSDSHRLHGRYMLLIGGLVLATVCAASAVQGYFAYRDARDAIAALTQEKAHAAALRIGHFVDGIIGQVSASAMPQRSTGPERLLERRFQYRQLLKVVPAISDLRQLDASGREEIVVSRTALDEIESGVDLSAEAGFRAARKGSTHFSPVYFRKDTEPYVTIAVAPSGGSDTVTIAELSLKSVWDIVANMSIGATGYAYVVDGAGMLIAHPALALVLQRTDLSGLPQAAGSVHALIGRSHSGEPVVAASARIEPMGWRVVVEQPLAEAHAVAWAVLTRNAAIAVVLLVAGLVGALVLARALSVPASELALANAAKSRFLAVASHDLRQPMHALSLFVAQLRTRPQGADQRRLVERIDESAQSLAALLDSLLDISRLDAGVVTPQPEDFPLERIFARMRNEFGPLAAQRGIELRVRATHAWVRSDPVLLERIVQNLVSNAVHHTQQGRVLVGCRVRSDSWRIDVIDTGPGIPAAEQERVFGEYYRLPPRAEERNKGLGLGLAIVQRLTHLLQHHLELASRLRHGTRFSLRVTRAEPLPAGFGQRAATTLPRAALVAVIDDDALAREATHGLLADWSCEVVSGATATEVESALLRTGRIPDLVMSDYHLRDGVNGLQAIAQLRHACGADIPACIVTADTSAAAAEAIARAGLHALTKPLAPLRLRALVTELLRTAAAQGLARQA